MEDRDLPRGVATVSGPVTVHFDGACEPPRGGGIATFGFHLEGGGFLHEDRGLAVAPKSPHSTNNVAEYSGAIHALAWLAAHGYAGPVRLFGDSQLVIRQMKGEYEVRAEHLKAYHHHLSQLAARFERVEYEWVPRESNARADALSKQALREAMADLGRRVVGRRTKEVSNDSSQDESQDP